MINRELGSNFRVGKRFHITGQRESIETMYLAYALALPIGALAAVADSLTITAQSEISIFNAISYKSLDGGVVACTRCASITLDSIPPGTQSVLVKAVLPAGVESVNSSMAHFGW